MTERRIDWTLALGAGVVTALVAFAGLTSNHPWGDDFAGYLLQARAIATGDVGAELRLNQSLLAASDRGTGGGPVAYPWGFPMLLWLGGLLGAGLAGLKLIGVLALGVTAAFTFLLARIFLSRPLALGAAALVVLQPHLLNATDQLLSDVPFLAVSTAALFVMVRTHAAVLAGRSAARPAVLAAALTVFAYTIRANGVFLSASLAAALGLALLLRAGSRRPAIITGLVYAFAAAALLMPYLALLPDFSAAPARMLTAEGPLMLTRMSKMASMAAELVPFNVARGPLLAAAAMVVVIVAVVWGAWRRWPLSVVPTVYASLTVMLLLTFPFNQGIRYLFPLLPAVCVLGLTGLREAAVALSRHAPAPFTLRAGQVVGMLIALTMLVVAALDLRASPPYAATGPFSPAMREVTTYLAGSVPESATVAFFKPRAMRLLSGRRAISVVRAESMDRAQWYVRNMNATDGRGEPGRWQLPDSVYTDTAILRPVFENSQFTVYRRQP